MTKSVYCSIIIPCYNEVENLPLLFKKCEDVHSMNQNVEIVIVDNGSTDNSGEVIDGLIIKFSFIKKVTVKINKGYGFGILEGLKAARGDILGWTHADMQTDLSDILKGIVFFENASKPDKLFIKGKRFGRPLTDVFFTVGMSIFETLLLKRMMWDINAQPTIFHKNFYLSWENPPSDFSLDLYAYYMAKKKKYEVKRFPVLFDRRMHGVSSWNIGFVSKYHFIKRTLLFSFGLNKRIR
jgi:glycosyltransferase involved in cell wall biosynthesis